MTVTRRQGVLALVGVVLLTAGGVYAWHRYGSGRSSAIPPDIPAQVVDPDVRAVLTSARQKVVATPQSGQAWGELGLLYRAHNLNVESNICFAEAARLDPRNPRWPYLIGMINLLIAPDDAVPHLQKAYDLAVEPEQKSACRLRLAEALLDRQDLAGAEKLFTEDVQASPQNPRAHFGLATVAIARGDHRAAIEHLLPVADTPFTRRKATALLAASYRQLGDPAVAERFERSALNAPEDLPWPDPFITEYARKETGRSARMKAVEELEAQGRIHEAVLALEEIAKTESDDQVLVSLGINQAKMGDFDRAERSLRIVLARSPDHAVARYFLGVSLFMQAERAWQAGNRTQAEPQFKEAVKELQRAAELKPDKGLANLYAGLALKYLGKLPEAAAECRAAIRASPQFGDAHLGLAEILIAMDKPDEAIPHLETAVRLLPHDARAKALLEKIRDKK
jgi:tetratricopeptide (TPR) repeat protein